MNVSDRAAGSTLEGRYRLEARLSNWGVGEAWRAVDTQRGRAVVTVKLLSAPIARRTERMGVLKILGDRLLKLPHANLLPLVEINTAGPQPFVVYEAWEGVGLGEWLAAVRAAGTPTPLRTALAIADRFLQGVGAGHRQRSPGSLVHGAIHHEAVRVRVVDGREPEVRVLDFGLSSEKDSSALAALVDSTPPEYAAPEHVREPGLRNPSADVFASAVLILRLLVPEATRPRGHRSWAHFVTQRESEVHSVITALREDVHPSVWEALAQGLARRPEARPADAEKLRELLRASSWGVPDNTGGGDGGLEPVVPMSLPTLHPALPAVAALSLAPPPPLAAVAAAPSPASVGREARKAGPPPVPTGMQLGVASVLGANRPGGASARPRRATADVSHRNFGPLAPRPAEASPSPPAPGCTISQDDAQSTRPDIELPPDEPRTIADVEPATIAQPFPTAPAMARVPLAQSDRTSRIDDGEHTKIAQLPIPPSAPMPAYGGSGQWAAGHARSFTTPEEDPFLPTIPVVDATVPLSLHAVPPEVAAALARYGAPAAAAGPWDGGPGAPPYAYHAGHGAPAQPPFGTAPYPPPVAAVSADPFALVASAGRHDVRAQASVALPARTSPPRRSLSTGLLVGLGLLAAALAFLVGVLVSSREPAAPTTVAPTPR